MCLFPPQAGKDTHKYVTQEMQQIKNELFSISVRKDNYHERIYLYYY